MFLSGDDHPLSPGTCGQCHNQQLDDWKRSRHARAMGTGVAGQFAGKPKEQVQKCLNCHAPLREQADDLWRGLTDSTDWSVAGESRSPSDSLHRHGVMCAACHVRGYRWFGPPRRRNLFSPDPASPLPHNGWTPANAFEDSRFCAACHQFPKGGYALNDKLIVNTYEEWKASPQADQGLTCQNCHMPDRRHLWRGIHDPETVRSGVSIEVDSTGISDDILKARLSLTNTGTGHFFPTYVTPSVVLEVYQEGEDGKRIDGTGKRFLIAREVSLDLTVEYSDTRVPPGQTVTLDYVHRQSPAAVFLVSKVRVEPDAFYSRFFQALLEGELAEDSRMRITQALRESNDSGFTLFEERDDIPQKTEGTDYRP